MMKKVTMKTTKEREKSDDESDDDEVDLLKEVDETKLTANTIQKILENSYYIGLLRTQLDPAHPDVLPEVRNADVHVPKHHMSHVFNNRYIVQTLLM